MQATHSDQVLYKLNGNNGHDVDLISDGNEIDRGVAASFDLSLENFNELPLFGSDSETTKTVGCRGREAFCFLPATVASVAIVSGCAIAACPY